jgi:phosphoglycolate phosphatase
MLRLVLWDVDHTLIENAGVSKEIYAAAFAILTGRRVSHPARTDGRTDPDIMAELLQSHGEPPCPWAEVQQALEQAGSQHRQAVVERGAVLPGVVELITVLAERPAVVQTVVTGNIRANAGFKLAGSGLLKWLDLDVGCYGSDDRERSRLVTLARTRAATKYGIEFGDEDSTVVIGDTPRDVEAARIGGARVLAVASGLHSVNELRAAGAGCVVPSLSDTAAALKFVLGNSR